jgi:hypothetical protein
MRPHTVLPAAALIAALSPATAAPETLVIPHRAGPVALDGVLDEPAWREAARLTHADFTRWIANQYRRDPDEFSVRLFHDGRTLYVALASYDRYVEPDGTADNSDGLYAFSAIGSDGRPQHYRLRWSANPPVPAGEMRERAQWGARLRGSFADSARAGGGYVLEFAIPLATLGWRAGERARINIIVHDHDGKAGAPYSDPAVEFARFAYGSLDNDNRAAYRAVKLAP